MPVSRAALAWVHCRHEQQNENLQETPKGTGIPPSIAEHRKGLGHLSKEAACSE